MSTNEIRFDDGAAYERYMGKWSQQAGETFLDWLAPEPGLRWLDVGCGNGAFTQLLIDRTSPSAVEGIDPSAQQIAYARSRFSPNITTFQQGDAMSLPFSEDSFDAAVMPLVIFFVPDPSKGVAEMARVIRPGGTVAAYAWDMLAHGFPYDTLWNEMRSMGVPVPLPPSPDASRIDVLRQLWMNANLDDVQTREIIVQRTYDNFDDYWQTILGGPSVSKGLASMSPNDLNSLQARMRAAPTGFVRSNHLQRASKCG